MDGCWLTGMAQGRCVLFFLLLRRRSDENLIRLDNSGRVGKQQEWTRMNPLIPGTRQDI